MENYAAIKARLMKAVPRDGQTAIGVAVRGPDGQIFAGQEPLDSILHRNRFARAWLPAQAAAQAKVAAERARIEEAIVAMAIALMGPHFVVQGQPGPAAPVAAWLRAFSPIPAMMQLVGHGDIGSQGFVAQESATWRYILLAVITGAGSGIGRALALNLAARGAVLALSDKDEVGLLETAERATARHAREVHTEKLDVSDRTAVTGYAASVAADLGRVNAVFNNAGIPLGGPLQRRRHRTLRHRRRVP